MTKIITKQKNGSIKFSITIPAFKAKFLNEAIRSVIMQSYDEWELIVLDDCSPENIQPIVEPYLNDERIHFYRNEKNVGAVNVVDNWNKCLNHCTGDYVICMGDDDRLSTECLSTYAKLVSEEPKLFVYHGRTKIIDRNGDAIETLEERKPIENIEDVLHAQWTTNRRQFIGDFLFSREWLMYNGGYVKFPLAYSSDWATANLATSEKGIANTNDVVFEYRENSSSISRTQNLKLTVKASYEVYIWYSNFISNININVTSVNKLKKEMNSYFKTKTTDMIYSDVKYGNISDIKYWIKQPHNHLMSKWIILTTCFRATISKLIK